MFDEMIKHLRRGGAAMLNHPGEYPVPEGAIVAPARYSARRGGSEFVMEQRYVDGEFRTTALVDSKGSQSNRAEDGILTAREEGESAAAIPTIAVHYGERAITDLELPHRAVDAHVRAAAEDGEDVVKRDWYRALRDATAVDLSAVFVTAPSMLAFGGWDSSRRSGQLRLRSAYVSELYGVVAPADDRVSKRAGARLDPLGQQYLLEPAEVQTILDRQAPEMATRTVEKIQKEIDTAAKKGAQLKPASLGLGGIPPATGDDAAAYGVAVPKVLRARTFSLAALRRLRFGGSAEEDVAARAALLGMLLVGAAYSDADPDIRAYCDVGAPKARTLLDDEEVGLDLSIDACNAFLAAAVERLPERLAWTGQQRVLIGAPGLDTGAAAVDDSDEK